MNYNEAPRSGWIQNIRSIVSDVLHPEPIPVVRTSLDGKHELLIMHRRDTTISSVVLYERGGNKVFRIMELYSSGLIIEAVENDDSNIVRRFGQYTPDGRLHLTGDQMSTSGEVEESRASSLQRGYFDMAYVPKRINFNKTADQILQNASAEEPSFAPPRLIPYEAK